MSILKVTAGLLAVIPSVASAGLTILKSPDIGPVISVDTASPEAAAGFLVGETLALEIVFDNTASDTFASAGEGGYVDLSSTLKLTGNTSGAMQSYAGGVFLELDDNEELEIFGLPNDATAFFTPILSDDIDLDTLGTAFFSDVDSLAAVFSDLHASPFPNNSAEIAATEFFNGVGSQTGMEFGPAPSSVQFAAIPEPSPVLLLGVTGLVIYVLRMTFLKTSSEI